MGRGIPHPGSGHAADHYGARPLDNGVGRTCAGAGIPHHGCGHTADENGRHTRADDRAAHMGNGRGKGRGLHGTGVHVG
jgi:hypothetical protein